MQHTAVVLQLTQQCAARTVDNFAVYDFTLYLRTAAGREFGDALQLCFVFIAQRQMQHQINAVMNTKLCQLGL